MSQPQKPLLGTFVFENLEDGRKYKIMIVEEVKDKKELSDYEIILEVLNNSKLSLSKNLLDLLTPKECARIIIDREIEDLQQLHPIEAEIKYYWFWGEDDNKIVIQDQELISPYSSSTKGVIDLVVKRLTKDIFRIACGITKQKTYENHPNRPKLDQKEPKRR